MPSTVLDRPDTHSVELEPFFELPSPVKISDLEIDQTLRLHAAEQIGAIITPSLIEVVRVKESPMTLMEACYKAKQGDPEAVAMVRTNVRTDYFERSYKSGHISSVRIAKTERGLAQHGQRLTDTHSNSIAFLNTPVLKDRAKTEFVNGVRNEHLALAGSLKDNISVTFSLVTRKVGTQAAKDMGFFTDTMSLAIQVMTEEHSESEDTGEVVLDTAFVAGRETDADVPIDIDAVRLLATELGIDYSGYDADDILAHPILVPKAYAKNALDIVRRYDRAVGRLTGRRVFFGKTCQEDSNYESYSLTCQQREKDIEDILERTVQSLLDSSHTFTTPTDATRLLDRLNDQLLKDRIISDTSIDPLVLGQKTVFYINHARHLYQQGNQDQQLMLLQKKITKEGASSSCPGGGSSDVESSNPWDLFDQPELKDEKNTELEDCDFISKECPKCHQKEVKTTVKNGKYYGECGCVG